MGHLLGPNLLRTRRSNHVKVENVRIVCLIFPLDPALTENARTRVRDGDIPANRERQEAKTAQIAIFSFLFLFYVSCPLLHVPQIDHRNPVEKKEVF